MIVGERAQACGGSPGSPRFNQTYELRFRKGKALVNFFYVDIVTQELLPPYGNLIERVRIGISIHGNQLLIEQNTQPLAGVASVHVEVLSDVSCRQFKVFMALQKTEDGLIARVHPFHPPMHLTANAQPSDLPCLVILVIECMRSFETTKSWARTKYMAPTLSVNGITRGPAAHRLGPLRSKADPEIGPRVRVGPRDHTTESMRKNGRRELETPERHDESQTRDNSCPNCGEPLNGITTTAPQSHTASPCGCEIHHSWHPPRRVATDGGQVERETNLDRAVALWIDLDLPDAEKPVLAMDTDAGKNVGYELGPSAAADLRSTVIDQGVVPDPGEHEFETKAVRVSEEENHGRTFLMLTRFRGEGALLGENGWVGEYIQFQVMSRHGQRGVCGTDPFDLCRRHPAAWFGESVAAALMKGLDMGHIVWEEIQDGDKLNRGEVDRLADNSTGDS